METKIILLINLIAYAVITGQSFMYIIALENVQRNMQAATYIEFRHLQDKNFRAKFKYPFYATLILTPATAVLAYFNHHPVLLIAAVMATIAIIADTIIMMKGNMPINNLINTWSVNNYPVNWKNYQSKWLYFFRWREVANITGFICLLAGALFG